MPTSDEWLALAERCEKAEVPDRELDAALAEAAVPHTNGTPHIIMWSVDPDTGRQIPNAFTRSLDAAVAVVEARFGPRWTVHRGGIYVASIFLHAFNEQAKREGAHSHASPALALMAAYCRARAEEETT